ncbi:hypothetical protein GCM10011611_44130 [Aliidongia dinghuensis]|uniref:Uncharacterized protein n=1 Tax=Aliidongia dinghuensis TaxID=1867774 RepID=A0A8J2YX23_9PROT|nr:hypothetical protein [Aliidongia dinghuensis]GGF33072.1 hypothetical protein GCM10011611_44130 [Aliidongia dinghuensis]
MTDAPVHLAIGTPCYGGQVTSQFAVSLLKLQRACDQRGIGFTVLLQGGDALVTRARQNVVAHFLGNPAATHLLFVDADIGFEPEAAFRLLDFGADMAAGVYPTKKIDWPKVKAVAAQGREPIEAAALSYVLEFLDPGRIGVRDGFARVRYAGTGFLMIRRPVLERMQAHYAELKYAREHQANDPLKDSPHRYALFDCLIDRETGTYLSEDFSFCRRWTAMGGEIWADLQSRLSHTGPLTFQGDVATQFGPA